MSIEPWIAFFSVLKFSCETPETLEILSRSATQETMLLTFSFTIGGHKQHKNEKN